MGKPYKIIHDGEHDSEWLEKRRAGIGASESPVILGLSHRQSIFSLYADKIGFGEDFKGNDATRMGLFLEDPILREYGRRTSREVMAHQQTCQSIESPFIFATPDGQQIDRVKGVGGVEIKLDSRRPEVWKDQGCPPDVYCQVQHQMYVMGWSYVTAVAFMSHGWGLGWVDVDRDEEFIKGLVAACEDFWGYIKKQIQPPQEWIDGHAKTREALMRMYPERNEKTVNLGGVWIRDFDDRMHADFMIKDWQGQKAHIDNKFRRVIGDANTGILPNGNIVTFTKSGAIQYKESKKDE